MNNFETNIDKLQDSIDSLEELRGTLKERLEKKAKQEQEPTLVNFLFGRFRKDRT